MAFCFNFSDSIDSESTFKTNKIYTGDLEESENLYSAVSTEYISLSDINFKISSCKNSKQIKCGIFEIKYITQKSIESKVEKSGLLDESNTDLLPGKYEGGLKVWECSLDLIRFLAENNSIQRGNLVLELGCGVGLPGILAYLCGGLVTFQDFNSEVLKLVTGPNVFLNTPEEKHSSVLEECNFLCGDWGCIKEKYYQNEERNHMFDIILTSETIYEKSNQGKLLELLKAALKPSGIIYLASKVHYFGVGGGIADFEELVKKDNTFECSTVFKTNEGVERRILKLTFKNNVT